MKNAMNLLPFQMDLQGYQMQKLDQRIHQIGEISDSDALQFLDRNEEEFYQYLFLYVCALYQDTRRTQISGTAGDFRFWRKSRDTGAGIQQIHAEIRKCKKKLQRVFRLLSLPAYRHIRSGNRPLFDT